MAHSYRARGQRSFVVTAVAAFFLGGAASRASAQDIDARFAEARTACLAGEVSKGTRLLAELYTTTNDAIWLFNLGRCYQQNRQGDQALGRFREYLLKTRDDATDDVKQTRSEADGYIKDIEAELAARRPPAEAAQPAAQPVARPADVSEAPPVGMSRLQIGGLVAGGVGVVSVGVGVVFGLRTGSLNDEVERKAASGELAGDALDRRIADGKSAQTWQWVGYGVGAAGLVGGTVMFVLGRRSQGSESASVALLPSIGTDVAGAVLSGRF